MEELKAAVGALADNGLRQAMANRWLGTTKGEGGPVVTRSVESVEDVALQHITALAEGARDAVGDKDFKNIVKRKLVKEVKLTSYRVAKGPEFALERKQRATDLTEEMIASGSWRDATFKEYNFNVTGGREGGGHLHPLLKVRQKFREIFIQMGFTEMPTNNYVESSFWNFDALFQPQQHPARDAHDTFFLTRPAKADLTKSIDADYLTRVRNVHESGGYDSIGYGYNWSLEEAEKNVLRTHTTAVSSRMLKRWADKFTADPSKPFEPVRYFSIDRVFRNEAIDRTHLAEFHQVEGVVCDRGLTLGHLMGTLNAFFERLGLPTLRFKPAYNPYTEPSMEIFSYHPALGKWVEVGNSGVFRPEMLRPMGLPEDVQVIAWGLSVERPTMILYGIDNIRELFGHKVSLPMILRNPFCRIGLDHVR